MSCRRVINIEIDLKLSSTFPSFQFNSIRSDSIASNPIPSHTLFIAVLIRCDKKYNNSRTFLLDYCIDDTNLNWRQSYRRCLLFLSHTNTHKQRLTENFQFKFKLIKIKSITYFILSVNTDEMRYKFASAFVRCLMRV